MLLAHHGWLTPALSAMESILDLLEMDDNKQEKLLHMDQTQLADVTITTNHYPNFDLQFDIESKDV
jgi:hypothetical protein